MSFATCRVQGCEQPAQVVFFVDDPTAEFPVCSFHFQALSEGEPWTEAPDSRPPALLMGADLPPTLIDGTWSENTDSRDRMTLALQVGRDGVVQDTFTFTVDRASAASLLFHLQRALKALED